MPEWLEIILEIFHQQELLVSEIDGGNQVDGFAVPELESSAVFANLMF